MTLRLTSHDSVNMNKPIEQSYWVEKGKFLAGEYPRKLDEGASRQKLRKFIDVGVNSFVDLTEEYELEPYQHLFNEIDAGDVQYIRFPIRDVSIPDDPIQVVEILDYIDQEIQDGRVVYIHCWGGIGRTGTIAGCWFSRHGEKGQMALTKLRKKWEDNPKSKVHDSPETEAQIQFVINWHETSG